MQVFAPRILLTARNDNPTGFTLLIEKVADAHPKRIRDLVQASHGDFLPPVHHGIDPLAADAAQTAPQLRVAHVFFIITRRRFNCEVYICCFMFSV